MADTLRGVKETLAQILSDPTREGLRTLLQQQTGETANLDFKAEWPEGAKLARHVLAFGNSGGGCMVVGVAEQPDNSLVPVGLSTLTDKVDLTKNIANQIPSSLLQNVDIYDFAYDQSEYDALVGKKFQILCVRSDPEHLPFVTTRANADARVGAIYIRRGTESVEANQDELQRLINQRLATGHSTAAAMKLGDHLDQLEVLEERIPRKLVTESISNIGRILSENMLLMVGAQAKPNPDFPEEDSAQFIRRMFDAKKKRIARELDVPYE